uniref:Peptidase S8/S53 domain-containing protein n=1 Tax=Panagrolaimus davidi TaxID=227884 RepID=A0A914QVE4_9BILA
MKVDIVNLSVSLDTEHEEVVNEMTEKHGIIVTKAAGNCGPVYSSLYETDVKIKNMFIIGSVFTKKDDFKSDAIIPTYSSRGPGDNGSRGISFVAPGDAITAVPRYCSIKHEILYGTSFSAPNAAGIIACLLSALKDNGIKYSVSSIKTALEKTAFLPKDGDVLGFGHGIIQIYDAFKFMKNFDLGIVQNYSNRKRKLKIISDESSKNGIFVRLNNNENDAIKDRYKIKLSKNDANLGPCNPKRIKLQSTTKPKNANFVLHSKITKNNSFKIAIQKHKLKYGALNYTEIHGILFSKISYFKQLFHLPITVISPKKVTKEEGYCIKENQLKLSPNVPHRFFILPPKECFQCIVTVAVETRASLYLQYSIENIYVSSTTGKWLEFNETTKMLTSDIKIYGNRIHEITIFPDIYEPIICDIEIQFYGIEVIKNSLENKNVEQNVITFNNNLQNLHATLIMEFVNVSFKLSPIHFNFETNKSQYDICENDCLKITYNFTRMFKS